VAFRIENSIEVNHRFRSASEFKTMVDARRKRGPEYFVIIYRRSLNGGNAALMQQAIVACEQAIAADASSLTAHFTLFRAHWNCHLHRWGDRPDRALERAWSVVEHMMGINSQDERTLTARGWIRVMRGEYSGGLADLRRAHEVNPNYTFAITALAFGEATTGLAREAEAHAQLAIRLSPRDYLIGTAHLALAMAHFVLRNYEEAARWCESAIQAQHRAPIRRALMIACSAQAGDMVRARSEIAILDGFAPEFIASLFRGENHWKTFWADFGSRGFQLDFPGRARSRNSACGPQGTPRRSQFMSGSGGKAKVTPSRR
jgi:tetratricopeptide (TPR) repeat protein